MEHCYGFVGIMRKIGNLYGIYVALSDDVVHI